MQQQVESQPARTRPEYPIAANSLFSLLVTLAMLCTNLVQNHAVAGEAAATGIIQNSIGMSFARVKVDSSSSSESIAILNRRLGIGRTYFIGVYEVRQSDFQKVLGRNPSVFASSGKLKERVAGVATDRLPVDSVSWHDANEFCQKLSKSPEEQAAGRRYRLPSSDEWEYAARAGHGGMWCFGDDRRQLDEYGWFGFDRCDRRPHVAGEKKANAFGLCDMYGNVWEWCQDADPRAAGKDSQRSRVIRGGGWMSQPGRCNSVYWQSDPPSIGDPDTGFRVIMESSATLGDSD